MPSAAATRSFRERSVCHVIDGTASPSRPANAATRRGPASPNSARVPTGPPSWTARASPSRSASSATTLASSPASHPHASQPKVIGSAACISVRPVIDVARCSRARLAQASAAALTSERRGPSARRTTSMAAVSRMSWLVAPQCTCRAADTPTPARRSSTSGMTGLPPSAARAPTSPTPNDGSWHAAAIRSASSRSIRPRSACACASAASASSIARSHAASETARAASPRA